MDNNKNGHPLIDITMPALGADMNEGTLLEWQVKPGDVVEKGATLAIIETSKGAIDMESYHSGTISELLAEPGTKLPVGSIMGHMTADSSTVFKTNEPKINAPIADTHTATTTIEQPTEQSEKQAEKEPALQTFNYDEQRQYASPIARKTAHLSGINLSAITGSGPQGAVLLRDINPKGSFPVKEPVSKTDSSSPEISPMRKAISDAMSRSKKEIPHYYLALDINLTKAQQWLVEQNQQREPEKRLLLPAVLLTAIARKLTKFPDLNGFYQDEHFTSSSDINIGNTISLREGGLVIPAILNADQLTLDQTMEALRDLAERSRYGRLRSSEISAGTITVTSIGERGADSITGVIYPPQVAIIGLGRLRQIPIANDGQIEIADVMTVTLAADHRVTDGITGAHFLNALSKQLQHPEDL